MHPDAVKLHNFIRRYAKLHKPQIIEIIFEASISKDCIFCYILIANKLLILVHFVNFDANKNYT